MSVDSTASAQMMKEGVLGVLSSSTRIISTHNLELLSNFDRVIVLENGKIVEDGSFKTLSGKKDGYLASLIAKDGKSLTAKNNRELKAGKSSGGKAPVGKGAKSDAGPPSGKVTKTTWWSYLKLSGGYMTLLQVILVVILTQVLRIVTDLW
jgi:ABC-type multidrug transport system ATPase subunit